MLWTEQGIMNFKDTMKRAKAAKSDTEKLGDKFTLYWLFGKYVGIGILEAPNEEAAMQFGLKVGSLGNTRTTKLRVFIEEEIVSVIDKLS
jgi:uncharacterized protein with GYD domain